MLICSRVWSSGKWLRNTQKLEFQIKEMIVDDCDVYRISFKRVGGWDELLVTLHNNPIGLFWRRK